MKITEHFVSTLFPNLFSNPEWCELSQKQHCDHDCSTESISLQFQLLGLLWMVWDIPTTALCTSQRLELVVQLCSALLHYEGAVSLVTVVGGSFPMELKWWEMAAYHTTELEYEILEHYISIATLWLPQQGSSAVMYLLLVVHLVIHRASMWGYTQAPLVSALN